MMEKAVVMKEGSILKNRRGCNLIIAESDLKTIKAYAGDESWFVVN
jgi:hypothetical protein